MDHPGTAHLHFGKKDITFIRVDFQLPVDAVLNDGEDIVVLGIPLPGQPVDVLFDKEPLIVASRGGWSALERPTVPEAVAAGGVTAVSSAQQDINTIAADISRQYLVWKNKDGSIGIGDTQYPERDRLEVASTGGWAVITEEPLPEKSGKAAPVRKGEQQQLDEKLLAAGISGQYLVWKDKNGQVGFGNVDYPELRNIDSVHTGGSWQKIVN